MIAIPRGMTRAAAGLGLPLAAACLLLAPASGTPASSGERGSPASRLSADDSATEYWDLAARFDTGHRLLARFLITNEGPGERTAVAVGHLVRPDGTTVLFRNGRRSHRWTLDADGLRLRIGSSSLDQSGDVRALSVDSTKQRIKIQLRFTPDDPPVWSDEAVPPDYWFDLLHTAAPVEGSVWAEGMAEPVAVRGTIAATHTWMNQTEAKLALRRIEFFSLQAGPSLYVADLLTPDGRRSRWLVIAQEGRILYQSADFELSIGHGIEAGTGLRGRAGYPIPRTLRIHSPEVRAEIQLGQVLQIHDPLSDLPQPFRFLLSFKTRPHRVWTDSPFELTLSAGSDRAALRIRGSGITSVTYLNPLPAPA